ncbi:LrgB family protein [Propionivibrio sp.]|uniref:LrgB family protein n=1 Tax=Propionivibrio sp. TaxID=2212460 RepID=UPI0025E376C9|nr:LrgB family protein [Propionivibrio sp.]MBK7357280.1 LrgB family protein [Propionivibrio sp.]MBK8401323.1 LrgB family protein [Propionivibrio sp.]MBK8746007.1 LrgB family protein [Propionivibrio sp.]MBK8892549.1 LrgB family protein [Propionivibrio sp.]MBL0208676.1 LrgB family protein [Propionivibrio sp.]
MSPRISELWVYLAASPLLGLTFTLLAYQGALFVNKRCHAHPLANPVLLAVAVVVMALWATGTPYRTYFDGAQFVHFLLGPATVALAIPLYAQLGRLKRMAVPLLVALLAGSITAACSAVLIGRLFGASAATLLSLAPKSVTTPIAMGIAEHLGGLPSLTAVLVILTGILGAVGANGVYALLKIDDPAVRGFALGTASHGIGTARAFQVNEQTGAFSALAMGLNGLLTALLLPWLMPLLLRGLG